MSGVFGGHYWQYKQKDIRLLIRNLYRALSSPVVLLDPPQISVEAIHRRAADGSEVISLINYSCHTERPYEAVERISDLTVRINTTAASAKSLKSKCTTRRNGEFLDVTLDRLGLFETICMEKD